MRISLDTNILIGILSGTAEGQSDDTSIQQWQNDGHHFLVCGVVYTELMAHPKMDRASVGDNFGSTLSQTAKTNSRPHQA
ncbi:hypothetical protein [Deinococcus sp. PESE-13]